MTLSVVNLTTGKTVACRVEIAESFWDRLGGLLGRPPLWSGQGLLIRPCHGVNTCFMRYPIEVIFLASDWTVVALVRDLRPFRFSSVVRRAVMALELPAGSIKRMYTQVGDALRSGRVTARRLCTQRVPVDGGTSRCWRSRDGYPAEILAVARHADAQRVRETRVGQYCCKP